MHLNIDMDKAAAVVAEAAAVIAEVAAAVVAEAKAAALFAELEASVVGGGIYYCDSGSLHERKIFGYHGKKYTTVGKIR